MQLPVEEEFWNTITHFIGLLLSIVGISYLIFTNNNLPILSFVGVVFFGFGLISVYLSSTLYHFVSQPILKEKLRIFDHISIYYLIAGSYAPVCLITLLDQSGIYILVSVCFIAILGTFFKFFYIGKFEKLSLVSYLLMGWFIIIDIRSLFVILELNAIILLILSGLSYTLGTIFYSSKKNMHILYGIFLFFLVVLFIFF